MAYTDISTSLTTLYSKTDYAIIQAKNAFHVNSSYIAMYNTQLSQEDSSV